jgi:hypothetical protein
VSALRAPGPRKRRFAWNAARIVPPVGQATVQGAGAHPTTSRGMPAVNQRPSLPTQVALTDPRHADRRSPRSMTEALKDVIHEQASPERAASP